jgi:hypothetical protein
MNLPVVAILSCVLVGVALLAFTILLAFRYVTRKFGTYELCQEGAIIVEDGVEFAKFFLGKSKIRFDEIRSVKILKWSASGVLFDPGALWVTTRFFGPSVMIKFNPNGRLLSRVIFKPSDAETFVNNLNSHLQSVRETSAKVKNLP